MKCLPTATSLARHPAKTRARNVRVPSRRASGRSKPEAKPGTASRFSCVGPDRSRGSENVGSNSTFFGSSCFGWRIEQRAQWNLSMARVVRGLKKEFCATVVDLWPGKDESVCWICKIGTKKAPFKGNGLTGRISLWSLDEYFRNLRTKRRCKGSQNNKDVERKRSEKNVFCLLGTFCRGLEQIRGGILDSLFSGWGHRVTTLRVSFFLQTRLLESSERMPPLPKQKGQVYKNNLGNNAAAKRSSLIRFVLRTRNLRVCSRYSVRIRLALGGKAPTVFVPKPGFFPSLARRKRRRK